MTRTRALLLAVASGLLTALALPQCLPWLSLRELDPAGHLEWLAWFSLVPAILALGRARSWRAALGLGLAAGLAYFYAAIWWVNHAMTSFGGVPLPLALIGLSLLVLYMAAHWALAFALAWFVRRRMGWPLWAHLPAIWVGTELLRNYLFSGFPWGNLGYLQARHLAVAQLAAVTGVYGIAALLVLVNAVLAALVEARSAHARLPWQPAAGAAVLLAAVVAYGELHLVEVRARAAVAPHLRVALVQGNVNQAIKNVGHSYGAYILGRYVPLTLEADRRGADLVAWPEAAYPFFVPPDLASLSDPRAGLPQLTRAHLLLGAGTFDERVGRDGRSVSEGSNSVFLLRPDLEVVGRYAKHHLVPFGEYVPLAGLLGGVLRSVVPQMVQQRPGAELEVLTFTPTASAEADRRSDPSALSVASPEATRSRRASTQTPTSTTTSTTRPVRLAPMICFDAIFPEVNVAFAELEPDLLLNPTTTLGTATPPAPTSSSPWCACAPSRPARPSHGRPMPECPRSSSRPARCCRGRCRSVRSTLSWRPIRTRHRGCSWRWSRSCGGGPSTLDSATSSLALPACTPQPRWRWPGAAAVPRAKAPPPPGDAWLHRPQSSSPISPGAWRRCGGRFDVERKRNRAAEITRLSEDAGFWSDNARAQGLLKEKAQHEASVQGFDRAFRAFEDARVLYELGEEAKDEATRAEAAQHAAEVELLIEKLEFERMLSGPHDRAAAIVEVKSGAGGVEAMDWAAMLYRMYTRYCERKGWEVEPADLVAGEEAGISSASFFARGEHAYGFLKAEKGVHRLVRISPFDGAARRQTSFAAVDVTPEIDDDIVIDIKEADVRVDTYRSSGAGGQKVNKTDSAVRLTHLPTGIVVAMQNERSQQKNRSMAWKILRSRLYDYEEKRRQVVLDAAEAQKKDINFGSQIRSYVLAPYRLVKDLRTGVETGKVDEVLDGELDQFVEPYLLGVRRTDRVVDD